MSTNIHRCSWCGSTVINIIDTSMHGRSLPDGWYNWYWMNDKLTCNFRDIEIVYCNEHHDVIKEVVRLYQNGYLIKDLDLKETIKATADANPKIL